MCDRQEEGQQHFPPCVSRVFISSHLSISVRSDRQQSMSKILCADVSGGLENIPVSFANDVDDEPLPYFEYTATNVPGEGACEDEFSNAYLPCKCATTCNSGCPCVLRSGHPYDSYGIVAVSSTLPIIECSSLCRCASHGNCTNRVVQMGTRANLQVFKTTSGKRFGLRTLSPIRRGQYVTSYAGEVIGLDNARSRVGAMQELDSCYVILVRESGTTTIVVDPSKVGNAGRFLNHSCNPNLVMIPVRTECVVPELALFATCDVSPFTELCFDYSGGSLEVREGLRKCCCGDVSCRGWLPYDKEVLGI
ncbi:histone-lysine N-methyltransferase SETMAR-like isoform X2 [Ornithodoros turicata]|uniref:histone-lysine N-methyltransferase SETMAR-like isoform X2 n=1 Tax=Ornithodoros turicata TaxID=34597 RepID=UPI003138896D